MQKFFIVFSLILLPCFCNAAMPFKVSEISDSAAVIDGTAYHAGETVKGYSVRTIGNGHALFSRNGTEYKISVDPSGRNLVELRLNPMIELDFLKKSDIYALRKKYVAEYPEFAPENYEPSPAVFGEIVDGRPWWGILGLSYYGAGEKSLEGPSAHSRFIVNPCLLVGLDEAMYYPAIEILPHVQPEPVYPEPQKLVWDADGTYGEVTYDMTKFLALARKFRHTVAVQDKQLIFIAYNARDLGLGYCQADAGASRNIVYRGLDQNVLAISQFIHLGRSSQYPGGSNNMSPHVPGLVFNFTTLPARAVFKLWRDAPAGPEQKPDFVFVVTLAGSEPPAAGGVSRHARHRAEPTGFALILRDFWPLVMAFIIVFQILSLRKRTRLLKEHFESLGATVHKTVFGNIEGEYKGLQFKYFITNKQRYSFAITHDKPLALRMRCMNKSLLSAIDIGIFSLVPFRQIVALPYLKHNKMDCYAKEGEQARSLLSNGRVEESIGHLWSWLGEHTKKPALYINDAQIQVSYSGYIPPLLAGSRANAVFPKKACMDAAAEVSNALTEGMSTSFILPGIIS